MGRFGFGLGVALLVLAASFGVAQLLALLAGTAATPVSLASVWAGLDPGSLAGFQALVEGSLGGVAWTGLRWLLALPAWIPLGLLGILLLLGRRRGRGGFD
ncbi:MAG TPA: hypothetical protein PKA13_21725 [Geminicoccaceae bacterium]|mgnify:CR=1 FL=1|nr:hypothetical protein [Geminicoccus sp.]HMU52414.1 hypothetical protein [Geminicoccaceae bacterium]